jgi:crotonobetainyl-CoA:carnitine CoA-transferase CaiB-like acyl-CoA transferase
VTRALDGIRVLDLTQVMAGPFCTMQLGDLGADVIKIEPPAGDLSRSMGGTQLRMKGGDSAPFFALNRNKRSMVLDLKADVGRRAFLELAASADVIVESFRPGVVARLGIGYDVVAARNPRVIYASISGFGQAGPYADRPGFDLIAQGLSGVVSVTGEHGGVPVKAGVPIADLAAGMYAVNAILAALVARQTTGRGQLVETSLFEAALSLAVWESTEYWATGEAPRAMGSAHRLSAPYQVFRTSDGFMTLAALTQDQWKRLCGVLRRESLSNDPRFATNADRMNHRPELVSEIETALAGATTAEWVQRFDEAGVPAGPIHDYAQVFADPHTRDRGMIQKVSHPVEGTISTLGFPIRMSETPPEVRRHPPLLGEHTEEILRGLHQ